MAKIVFPLPQFCYVYNILINSSLYAMLFNKIVAVPNY